MIRSLIRSQQKSRRWSKWRSSPLLTWMWNLLLWQGTVIAFSPLEQLWSAALGHGHPDPLSPAVSRQLFLYFKVFNILLESFNRNEKYLLVIYNAVPNLSKGQVQITNTVNTKTTNDASYGPVWFVMSLMSGKMVHGQDSSWLLWVRHSWKWEKGKGGLVKQPALAVSRFIRVWSINCVMLTLILLMSFHCSENLYIKCFICMSQY